MSIKARWRGKVLEPYESFYWNTTDAFFRGQLGGGLCRCIKTDESLSVIVEYEPEDSVVSAEVDRGQQ